MALNKLFVGVITAVMLMSPVAGAAGAVSPAPQAIDDPPTTGQPVEQSGDFINVTQSVDVWNSAPFTLRVDRSQNNAIATAVENMDTGVRLDNLPPGVNADLGINRLVVHENAATIDLGFDPGDNLDNEQVHLISARIESTDTQVPSTTNIDTLRQFIRDNADSDDVTFDNISSQQVTNGGADFTINNAEPGSYLYMAVVTNSGQGLNVDNNGDITVPGEVSVVGVDSAIVQETASTLSVQRASETYAAGDSVTFDVNANLGSSDIEHAVAIWNESQVASENLALVAPSDIDADTTPDEFEIEHSIDEVNGVQRTKDDVSAFGRTLTSNKRSGVYALPDVITFLANEGEFSEPQTDSVGDSRINASVTSKQAGSDTTLTVDTLENFAPGEYVAVHVAMVEGEPTRMSSNRVDFEVINAISSGSNSVDDGRTNVQLTGDGNVRNVSVRLPSDSGVKNVSVTESSSPTGGAPTPDNSVATYLDISGDSSVSEDTEVTVTISQSRLDEVGIATENAVLLHYVDGAWKQLATDATPTNGDVRLTATSSGLSPFAVAESSTTDEDDDDSSGGGG
ncbi:hypothetical protein DJ83_05175, partial [Halorubrum ezzemoulense]